LFPADEPVTALVALENKRKEYALPQERAEFWDWCLERSQEELLQLLALCAAHAVDAVQDNSGHSSKGDSAHADQLAVALNLDMRKWFTCTAENIFNRISRRQIAQAYMEATGEPPSNALLGLKKKELAIRAERDIGDKCFPPRCGLGKESSNASRPIAGGWQHGLGRHRIASALPAYLLCKRCGFGNKFPAFLIFAADTGEHG
jgi:hypothetical protein